MEKLFILFFVLVFYISCAAPDLPKISPRPISQYTSSKTIDGLSMAIDPYFEEERMMQLFGINLISKGILPVFTIIENGSNTILFVEKANFSLQASEGKNNKLSMDDYRKIPDSKTEFIVGAGVIGLAVPASFFISVPLMEYFQDKKYRIVQTLISLELPDKTLATTEAAHGFIYFRLPPSDTEADDLKRLFFLRAKFKKTKSDKTLDFDFPILTRNGENR